MLYTFSDIFWSCIFWTVVETSGVYFFIGCFLTRRVRVKYTSLVPVVALIFGAVVGFLYGVVGGSLVAAVFRSAGTAIEEHIAAFWGLGFAGLALTLSTGKVPPWFD
eukprot:TRINITY_DN4145_c0_g3_i4.p1 TRINITY_DN4145_c0_g3~~TRINITY_DN4145_c0_g3_i4.p1  ORF type:complete len:107 (-),score=16.27 TRINITY_DN4145_c0_g3_i4:380-700(-)